MNYFYDAFENEVRIGDAVVSYTARYDKLVQGKVININNNCITIQELDNNRKYVTEPKNIFGLYHCKSLDDMFLRLEEHKEYEKIRRSIIPWSIYEELKNKSFFRLLCNKQNMLCHKNKESECDA